MFKALQLNKSDAGFSAQWWNSMSRNCLPAMCWQASSIRR